MKSYREKAGEIVANNAMYMGGSSPTYDYYIRFEGKAYFSSDTSELAEQIEKAMKLESGLNKD